MKVTETEQKLINLMKELNFSKEAWLIGGTNLETEEQQQQMIDYLIEYKNIMTEHQAIQHLRKIIKNYFF